MANLITGDAITLDLRIAGLPSRSLALAIDLTIQVGLLLMGTVLVSWVFSAGGSPGAQAAVTLVVVVLALVGWPTMVETLTRGRSVGKMVMGLRVVRDDGGPIRMRHSLVRALAMVFLDFWVTSGVVGGLSALASARSKRMGDHLAGTIVVGERIPRHATAYQEITMPPPLVGWAAGLDLVAVPDGLALNVRTFLHRAPSLDPAIRVATAERLATQMAGYVRTPAPLGTPAEAYLAAVLAERTRRAATAGPAHGWSPAPVAPAAPPPVAPPPSGPPPSPSAAPPPAAPGTPPTGFTLPQ
ncbi:MAG TPA: RDD family protein [Candidatus Limnocylindrales bacterium]|nr:RDD family protein [Candidatus Limnocylindrales bacterium]